MEPTDNPQEQSPIQLAYVSGVDVRPHASFRFSDAFDGLLGGVICSFCACLVLAAVCATVFRAAGPVMVRLLLLLMGITAILMTVRTIRARPRMEPRRNSYGIGFWVGAAGILIVMGIVASMWH